jgi:hypothetical protein
MATVIATAITPHPMIRTAPDPTTASTVPTTATASGTREPSPRRAAPRRR